MPVSCITGLGWGDEGKGKIVDLLSENVDVIVRGQGGANAGHTVVIDDNKYILHLIPSGILHDDKVCVIGSGVVFDPAGFLQEVAELKGADIRVSPKKLMISSRAHLVMPYHKLLDKLEEGSKKDKIGTTGRGIGPCYADKYSRVGIRVGELADPAAFGEHLRVAVESKNRIVTGVYGAEPLSYEAIYREYMGYAEKILPFIGDTVFALQNFLNDGREILLEGAQGTLLDVDYGTYPYVTSSSPTTGGMCVGAGLPPLAIRRATGIVKAYTTRVGAGPFPTELEDETGKRLRDKGGEYGATTGRPRRCGWLDAFAMKFSAEINGITHQAITKLDVLTGIDPIKICVAYRIDGKRPDGFPATAVELDAVEPVYEELPGWNDDLSGCRTVHGLPSNARRYVERMEQLIGVPASVISVGQRRSESIVR